jgi:hypothetical protein
MPPQRSAGIFERALSPAGPAPNAPKDPSPSSVGGKESFGAIPRYLPS